MTDVDERNYKILEKELEKALQFANVQEEDGVARLGEAINSIPKDLLLKAADASKSMGNEQFSKGKFKEALEFYTSAIAGDPRNDILYCNRAACSLELKAWLDAITDCGRAISLNKKNIKAYYRLGTAMIEFTKIQNIPSVEIIDQAVDYFKKGLQFDSKNSTILRAIDLAKHTRVYVENFIAQATGGKITELETPEETKNFKPIFDLSWAYMNFSPSNQWYQKSKLAQILGHYLTRLSDTEAPRNALKTLEDNHSINAYVSCIHQIFGSPFSTEWNVLHIGTKMGLLPTISAKVLTDRYQQSKEFSQTPLKRPEVTAVEKYSFLARIATGIFRRTVLSVKKNNSASATSDIPDTPATTDILDTPVINDILDTPTTINTDLDEEGKEKVVDISDLTDCMVKINFKKIEEMIVGQKEDMESKATVCIIDNFDCGLLGYGAYKSLLLAQENLLTSNALIVPCAAQIYVMAVEMRTTTVCGFDLSEMNSFRWGPHYEPIDLTTTRYVALSDPIPAIKFDFTSRGRKPDGTNSTVNNIEVPIIREGVLNAVVFWYDLHLYGDIHINTSPDSTKLTQSPNLQALQYLGREIPVSQGISYKFLVKHNTTKITIEVEGPPLFFDRYIPRWQFPVFEDETYHLQFRAALQQAIYELTNKGVKVTRALKVGAGSACLLGMIAASASVGAQVWSVEHSKHLSSIGQSIIKKNHLEKDVFIINKDFFQVEVPNDMPHKCNILLCEAFDVGCLGEDILSIVQRAKATLLFEKAIVIPGKATIFAMGIHLGIQNIKGINMGLTNAYYPKTGYYSIDLERYHNAYLAKKKNPQNHESDIDDIYYPITEPFEVFSFNFETGEIPMEGRKELVEPAINTGVLTSIAFWFELELIPGVKITTQPFMSPDKVINWQQAVQNVPELEIKEVGCPIPFLAVHNKNSVFFGVRGKELDLSKASLVRRAQVDFILQEATRQVGELGYQFSRISNMNAKDMSLSSQVASRIASQAGAFDLDPQIASNVALSYFV